MRELRDRVAVITGGASGIGRGMALAFAEAGMHVALADIDVAEARKVAAEIEAQGAQALVHETDVRRRDDLVALADAVQERFGAVHVLCNNAGVATFGRVAELSEADWRWVLDINLHGVVHGIEVFVPRMLAQDGEKHVVNTASSAGLVAFPGLAPYVASKYAVVGISEVLRAENRKTGLGVSVLCPGNVATRIVDSERHRGGDYGAARPLDERVAATVAEGQDPLEVGRRVRQAVLDDEDYILTHPEIEAFWTERDAAVRAAFLRGRTAG